VGYPPIRIKGQRYNGFEGKYSCKCKQSIHFGFNVSSAKLENGIEINLVGEITSVPYIKMTLALLNDLDVKTSFEGNVIKVYPKATVDPKEMTVESDWSSLLTFSLVALSETA
jgi:3-phosphoshikimate 1-carboxyvinyltransferase